MTDSEALIALNLAGGIGTIRLKKLLDHFNSPKQVLNQSPEKLSAICGISVEAAGKISSFKPEDLDKELKLARKFALKIVTLFDFDYPKSLKYIPDPPIALYLKGELCEEDIISVAVVGSRRASFYGLNNAENFSFQLAQRGFTIISGLARGIDTRAHQGALKAKARTIAVIGSGFANIYPSENKKLADTITACGAVISEFPVLMKPLRENFPRRNRIISGLSLGTLVVEAARNSGALITADFALEQGKDVFAIPGKVDSPVSYGTNELIKQGAKLVSCVDDIIEELGICYKPQINRISGDVKHSGATLVDPNQSLSNEEASIYQLLSLRPVFFDEIADKLSLSISDISDILFKLQMKRLIKQLPGKQFTKL